MEKKLIHFVANYFNKGDDKLYQYNVTAFTREEAIALFEEQYPYRRLVSLKKL